MLSGGAGLFAGAVIVPNLDTERCEISRGDVGVVEWAAGGNGYVEWV